MLHFSCLLPPPATYTNDGNKRSYNSKICGRVLLVLQ